MWICDEDIFTLVVGQNTSSSFYILDILGTGAFICQQNSQFGAILFFSANQASILSKCTVYHAALMLLTYQNLTTHRQVKAHNRMKTLLSVLDSRTYRYVWRLSVSLVLLLTVAVIVLGDVIVFDPFYALPITLASWYGSRKSGVFLALLSAVVLVSAKSLVSHEYISMLWYLVETLSYAAAYVSLAVLVTNFRSVHRVEAIAADTDNLTGIYNTRGFYAELANELVRSIRYNHVFSLAYLDIDNFKYVNDSLGHFEGDRLLVEVANCLKRNLRKTDIAARIGGDEFACLFPETEQDEAKAAFAKTGELLRKRMKERGWPVSFSVGLVTFATLPNDIKEALKVADELMYSVKNGEKNNVAYKVWRGST